jgi:hypothetical protein
MSKRAMQAARVSLATRNGGYQGELRLEDVAAEHGVGVKYVKYGRALLRSRESASGLRQSQFDALIEDVDSGRQPIYSAYQEHKLLTSGNERHHSGIFGLYLIDEGNDDEYSKVGVGQLPQRFDHLQEGNHRSLRLMGFWQCSDKAHAMGIEAEIRSHYDIPSGGTEWLRSLDYRYVHSLCVERGALPFRPVPGFDVSGYRKNGK